MQSTVWLLYIAESEVLDTTYIFTALMSFRNRHAKDELREC